MISPGHIIKSNRNRSTGRKSENEDATPENDTETKNIERAAKTDCSFTLTQPLAQKYSIQFES